jgi:hypothetical protein
LSGEASPQARDERLATQLAKVSNAFLGLDALDLVERVAAEQAATVYACMRF